MKMTIRSLIVSAVAGALLVAMGGCGGCGYDEKKPIATIDGKNVIRVGDFVYHYKRAVEMAPPQDKPVINTFDDAKDFLDDIVTSRVLEMEGETLGFGKDPALIRDIETYRSELLREKTHRKITDNIKITEAEILDYYNKNKEWRKIAAIGCDKKENADKAYAELNAGKPWDDVCVTYSIMEENKKNGGVMPTEFPYGGDNVARAVYDLPIGKYTAPIEVETGGMWIIARVDKKVPGEKREYAEIKDGIRDQIKNYKTSLELKKLITKLRKEAKIEVNQKVYDDTVKGDVSEAAKKYNRTKPPTVLATVGAVPIYFDMWYEGLFLQFRAGPEGIRDFQKSNPEQFKQVMDERLRTFEDEALLEFDALRNGVDKTEDFNREVNKFRAGRMVDRLYNDVFLKTVPPLSDEDVKAYYESHKAEFQDPEKAGVFLMVIPDQAKATEIYEKVKAGADMGREWETYAKAFGAALEAKGEAGQPLKENQVPTANMVQVTRDPAAAGPDGAPSEEPIVAEIRPKVFAAKKGDLVAPFKLKDGRWALFQYLEYAPLVQHTLEEEGYMEMAKSRARDARLASPEVDRKCQQWFKDLRTKHKIVIDDGALKMAFKKVQKL